MAVIGATAMIAFRVFSPAEAVSAVDFTTLVLLFAMMVIVASLHLAGFFEWLTSHIVCRFPVGYLLPGVIFVSGLLSAFLVNDVVCVFMTPLLLRIAKEVRRPALPYLLALATASNIGSTATITGNPQNMLIGSVSHIGYSDFLLHLGPVAVVGLLIDWGLLRLLCTKDLNAVTETTYQQSSYMAKPIPHPLGADVGGGVATHAAPDRIGKSVLVTVLVLIGFLVGWPPALVAAIGAAALLTSRNIDPKQLYGEVDWGLLLFFASLFVILAGAEAAGITQQLLAVAGHIYLRNSLIFAGLVSLLSNIVSNVPAVMLLRPIISKFQDQHTAWLLLSMASTLAGNITITGSVANIVVVEKARPDVHISFTQYLRIGVPVTVLTSAAGLLWLKFVHY